MKSIQKTTPPIPVSPVASSYSENPLQLLTARVPDVNAIQAQRLIAPRPPQINPMQLLAGKTASALNANGIVQRKMGFEFETDYTFMVHNGRAWQDVGRTKGAPVYQSDSFAVEGDTHSNLEFILNPYEQQAEAEAAAMAAYDLTAEIDKKFKNGYAEFEVGGNWKRKTQIKDKKDSWLADAQVTQGVKMEHLHKYMEDHLTRKEQGALAGNLRKTDLSSVAAAVQGFVKLIIKFVMDFQAWKGENNEEGPKNAQVWMARTRYLDMAKSLDEAQLGQFKGLFFTGTSWKTDNPVTQATGVAGTARVIPGKFLDRDEHKVDDLTTLSAWISELCAATGTRDSMSPPAVWAGGNYGMGYLGMDAVSKPDTPLVLLEYRRTDNRTEMGETSGKNLASAAWSGYVEEQFDKATEWNDTLVKKPDLDDDGEAEGE